MTKPILALQMDPLETLQVSTDSSLYLAFEGQERGFQVFTYQPSMMSYCDNVLKAKGKWLKLSQNGLQFDVIKEDVVELEKANLLLIRQDPPFNMHYLTSLHLLELIQSKTHIVNSPIGIKQASEKILPLHFKEFIPPTCITESVEDAIEFLNKHQNIILKPIYGHGGNGVVFFQKHQQKEMETTFLREARRLQTPLILQKHLQEIQVGDKRIHFLNGKPICAFKRVPKEGHYLSNLAQGGYAKATDLTNRDIQICEKIGPILKKLGLVLVGIDVLGDFLLEINITSPTGYRMAYELYGINIPKLFFDSI